MFVPGYLRYLSRKYRERMLKLMIYMSICLYMVSFVFLFAPVCVPDPQNAEVEAQVRPALDNLVDDADRDVRYFSRKAMQAVSAMG